jgi:hypothetical protein
MGTKTTFFKSKPCKIIGAILFLALLARISEALVFMSFFFIMFVLIFRSNVKYKEKHGHWPVTKQLTKRHISILSPNHPDYDMNPLNSGGAAGHTRRIRCGLMSQ